MIIDELKKDGLKKICSILFFVLIALATYPKPWEIISFFLIGLGILLFLTFICEHMERLLEFNKNKITKPYVWVYKSILTIYSIAFLLIFTTSWFEDKIIFNIFEAERGRRSLFIALFVASIGLIYSIYFYLRYHRLPTNDDFNFNIKSRNLTQREIIILVGIGLCLLFAFLGYTSDVIISSGGLG
jgi:uncharacterized membrane protein YidH (DUF202 family)